MFEEIGEDEIAAPVRQAVGEPGHQRAGDDDEQAEADPCADQRRQHVRGGPQPGRKRAGQRIDDVAEQNRLDELRDRQRDIGNREHDGEPCLGFQKAEQAQVNAQKRHDRSYSRR